MFSGNIKYRPLYVHALVWVGIVIITYTLLISFIPAEYAFYRAVIMGLMTAVLHYSNAFIFNRTAARGNMLIYFVLASVLGLMLTFIRALIEQFLLPISLSPTYFHANPSRPLLFFIGTFLGLLVSFIILYSSFLSKKEKVLLQTINNHNQARLRYLQGQINPHFLFNALNNIYSLVITRSDKASDTLLKLTDLLRYSVYQKEGARVPVSTEAAQINLLINLFTLRRDEPYKIEFINQRSAGNIEPMILVPLAENCLKHCNFDWNEQAYTRMFLLSDEKELRFETENTFEPQQRKDDYGGVGLENIKERLQLIYGTDAQLTISATDNIFRVQLKIQWKQN